MTNLVTLDLSTLYFSRVPSLKLENPNLLTLVQNLTGLKQLLLDGVNISTQGSQWCEAISSSLPYLQILSLSNCYLSGPIDSSLQKLQFLSDIRLSQNNLSALVREIFADLPNLRSLHLCFSSFFLQMDPFTPTTFSGTLPDSVGNLRVLSRIELSRCNFSGLIPNSIANLTQLPYLDLSYNNFTGTIPSFQMSKNITYINLSYNALTGSIHSSFFELRSLNVLMLCFNNFSGTMQLEMIQRLQNLTELELSYNSLSIDASGSKSSLSSFPQLDILKMASCKLQRFPELQNQSRMIILELSANQISGRIPNWICKIGSLMQLDVSHNLLVDLEKPYKFPSLFVLDLHSNQLHGEIPIPPEFVMYVDYSSNHFNSSIPAKIGTSLPLLISSLFNDLQFEFLKLIGFYYQDTVALNNKGMEMELVKILTVFNNIDISNNNFQGVIPNTAGDLKSLYVLNASHNALTGPIPSSIWELGIAWIFRPFTEQAKWEHHNATCKPYISFILEPVI
ncbi:hypothetical protein ACSBR1_035255 [Camellia fascicularis]